MIYDYKVISGTGEEIDLADYKGKVIMVVNTATGCTADMDKVEECVKALL